MRNLERRLADIVERVGCTIAGFENGSKHRKVLIEVPGMGVRSITYSRRPKNVEEIADNIGKTIRRWMR